MIEYSDVAIDLRIKKIKTFPAFIIVMLITLTLGFIEFLTGIELTFSLFYLVPITLAILLSGRKLGIIFGAVLDKISNPTPFS
jgi:hypothetical protein